MGCATSLAVAGSEEHVKHVPNTKPGKLFHREYILTGRLGKGGFAQVHSAKAGTHGSEVAVKIADLRASKRGQKCDKVSQRAKCIVMGEVAVLRRVGALPHCVAFHEEFVEGFLSYIVMEKCEMTLLQALETTPELTERTLVRIFTEMLQALDSIHMLQMVHRDIKPDNFLCCGAERTIKLCDFGLVGYLPSSDGKLSEVCGTVPYMSPEMVRGDGYGTETDIWSLGALAYVLLCGRFPYQPRDRSSEAMIVAISVGTPSPTFLPADKLYQAGLRLSPEAPAFLRLVLDRDGAQRASAADALQCSWLASPGDGLQSEQPLRPMLHAAKRTGAFNTRYQNQKRGDLDTMLEALQQKYQGDRQRRMAALGVHVHQDAQECNGLIPIIF
eukprot:CAMPEP_0179026764 /NCGR_PEP_ID=MMETSP0796-20121207/8688_1 /TAXON_ID=73915 /ORGANISM="Pyrodinium bahamense, Strain pbaha01" /LENGTH=385 /DNA_ID=CAMNT_0020722865 /DNA_START=1 /DNA_END=1158 /DNA_ORIENTATION=+